jgi:hypothetical protein
VKWRLGRILRFVIVLTALTGVLRSQGSRRVGVAGIIVRGHTNDAFPGVSIQLTTDTGSETYVTTSGSDGRFQFQDIPQGDYLLAAAHAGYLRFEYGKRRSSDPSLALPVTPSKSITGIRLAMIPAGSISGRINDKDGRPEPAVLVQALKQIYAKGDPVLQLVQTVTTDDRGDYRLFGLEPGNYYVSTSSCCSQQQRAYAPDYFPSTSDIRAARIIEISEGLAVGGINIISRGTRGVDLRILSSGPQTTIMMVPDHPFLPSIFPSAASDPATGMFQFLNVFPGLYRLIATDGTSSAWTSIDVGSTDILDLRMDLPRPVEVALHVVQKSASTDPDLNQLALNISPWPDFGVSNMQTKLGEALNGSRIPLRLGPGDYQVTLASGPEQTYIESMRLNNLDVANDGLHIDASTTGTLEVVLDSHPGAVEGTVTDGNRAPESNINVVLAPEASHRRHSDLYKVVRTDTEGRFRMANIPPGNYVLFSWESVEPTAWMNPDFMRNYEQFGRPVVVGPDSQQNITLIAIP